MNGSSKGIDEVKERSREDRARGRTDRPLKNDAGERWTTEDLEKTRRDERGAARKGNCKRRGHRCRGCGVNVFGPGQDGVRTIRGRCRGAGRVVGQRTFVFGGGGNARDVNLGASRGWPMTWYRDRGSGE
jgi:hypothetical protein